MTYQPTRPRIETTDGLRDWVESELDAIALQFAETQSLELRTIHQAPTRPRDGMIVHADGTDWNPGYGEGLYVYQGGWQLLTTYSYGLWTPTLTFATPGDLAVTYSSRSGSYVKIGHFVHAQLRIETSVFTHTTSAGDLNITGLPFTALEIVTGTGLSYRGNGTSWQGITKANFTDMMLFVNQGTTTISLQGSGSGQIITNIGSADMPTGGNVAFRASLSYRTAS